ncbi:MAG: hypothetical protein ACHBMF_00705 [Chromatiales bacterium]
MRHEHRNASTCPQVCVDGGPCLHRTWAGEFYEKDGAAIKGYDPVAYFKEQ